MPGEEERQQGDTIPDEQAQAALEAVDDASQQEQLQAVLGEALEALPAPQGTCCGCGLPAERHGQRQPRPWYQPPGGSQSGTAGLAASPGKACCSGAENRLLGGRGLSRHGVVFLVLRAGKRGGKAGRKQGKRHLNNQKNISSYKEKGSDLRQVLPERPRRVVAATPGKPQILKRKIAGFRFGLQACATGWQRPGKPLFLLGPGWNTTTGKSPFHARATAQNRAQKKVSAEKRRP